LVPLLVIQKDKLVALGAIEGVGLLGRKEAALVLRELMASANDEDIMDALEKSQQQVNG
jgi:hypothetical protein